MLDEEKLQFLK